MAKSQFSHLHLDVLLKDATKITLLGFNLYKSGHTGTEPESDEYNMRTQAIQA